MPEQQTEERQHTISKHAAEAYLIKHKKLYWGYFFIGKSTLAAHTDFGDFAFHWSAPDTNPKDFLIHCDGEYILRHTTERNVFDSDATRLVFVDALLRSRRDGEFTKDRARELYRELKRIPGDELMEWGREQKEFGSDCWEWARYAYPAPARAMIRELWPLFIEQLKAERAAETAPQEATA